MLELDRLAASGMGALAETFAPQGYNVGWNLGRIAGAGVVDHVHLHVVPALGGDTNFMPVLADVKVLPQHLDETRRRSPRPGRSLAGEAAPGARAACRRTARRSRCRLVGIAVRREATHLDAFHETPSPLLHEALTCVTVAAESAYFS